MRCKKKSSVSPVRKDVDGNFVADDAGRATLLNEAFASKFSEPTAAQLPEAPIRVVQNATFVEKYSCSGLIWFSEAWRFQWCHFHQDLIWSRGSSKGLKFYMFCPF